MLHWTKDTGLDITGKCFRVNCGKLGDSGLWNMKENNGMPREVQSHHVERDRGETEKVIKAR